MPPLNYAPGFNGPGPLHIVWAKWVILCPITSRRQLGVQISQFNLFIFFSGGISIFNDFYHPQTINWTTLDAFLTESVVFVTWRDLHWRRRSDSRPFWTTCHIARKTRSNVQFLLLILTITVVKMLTFLDILINITRIRPSDGIWLVCLWLILSQWAWFSLSTRSFIGSDQNSAHSLLLRGG